MSTSAINVDFTPAALRESPQWVLWRKIVRHDKPTKAPFTAEDKAAKSNDPTTWTTFDNALARFERGGYDGLGFMFSADDQFCGVDLDSCRNPETGEIADWAMQIVERFDTYSEISPSGTGVKMFLMGKWPVPKGKNKKLTDVPSIGDKVPGIEVYDKLRYFAVTGQRIDGAPAEPQERQQEIDDLAREHWPKLFRQSAHRTNGQPVGDNVLERARKYLSKIPPAVSGQRGHDTTYHAACSLVVGFRLERDDALALLKEWNESCEPPWSDAELEHKIDGALQESGERGYLLNGATDSVPSASRADHNRRFALTDLGNAERLVARHGRDLRYCHPWGKWLVWDGRRWRVDDTAEVERRAQDTIRAIDREVAQSADAGERKALRLWATKCEDAYRLRAMIELARSQAEVPILPDNLDSDIWLLNVANGTVDLRTGQLHEHRRDDYLTKLCPADYLPANEAEAPLWSQFLDDVFQGDDDVIAFVQRLLGYCLTGDVREHVLPIFWGSGANGKSTLLDTIAYVMGDDYSAKAPDELLMEKRGDRHPTERATLFGRRLVVASETDGGRRLAEATVKKLTGDGKIPARRMREDYWEFDPTHKLILVTNHKPIVYGRDLGIWRRLLLIPFTAKFEGKAADLELPAKLRDERDGILRWLVEGCLAWQREGLNPPESVRLATREYQDSQDTLKEFIEEVCIECAGETKVGDVFKAYRNWSEARNERPMSMVAFGNAMAENGIDKERKRNGWHYLRIGINAEV